MIRQQSGFTLLETLVALVIASMGIVAVSQMIGGAARCRADADSLEQAATLADLAVESALLPGEAGRQALDAAVQQARSQGWTLTVSRRRAALPDTGEEIYALVDGPDLKRPFGVRRWLAAGGSRASESPE